MKKKSPKIHEMSIRRAEAYVLTLCCAWLKDEDGWTEEKLIEFYMGIARWCEAIEKHELTIKQVKDIIKSENNIDVRWKL